MPFPFARIYHLFLLLSAIGIILLARLFYLQIFISDDLAALGLLGRVQEVKMVSLRGDILARNGEKLTNSIEQYNLTIFPGKYYEKEGQVEELSKILSRDSEDLKREIKSIVKPKVIAENLSEDIIKKINQLGLDGFIISKAKVRYGENIANHIVGYINKSDNKGVSGIEYLYDDILKVADEEYVAALIDARSELIPGLSYKKLHLPEPYGNNDVRLTIDYGIQKKVEEILDENKVHKAAVVVMNPKTGEILSMVSRPNFMPGKIEDYFSAEDSPLLNRAVSSYQPGSVFKLVVAAAALEKDIVKPKEVFNDDGFIDVDGIIFRGWDEKSGKRKLTFEEAIAYSSNPVLIQVGLKLGFENLKLFAQKFGFGNRTDLNFPNETLGNLPTNDQYHRGELANFSIGQGKCEVTPLQMACFTSAIANDGSIPSPKLVIEINNRHGDSIKMIKTKESKKIFSSKTAKILKDMMLGVTSYGTGQAAYVKEGGSAGKTGSAETGKVNEKGKSINHAWFVGFAPFDEPEYTVVVFVEDGMSGGNIAAPLFRQIIESIEKAEVT